MKAIILAAGRGERMRPLTDTMPKPLLTVAGVSLLERHIAGLAAAGITDLVINLSWLGHLISRQLGDGSALGVRIQYSQEGATPLETGGGIFRALPLLGDAPFWVVNGDVYCDYSFPAQRLAPNDDAHLVLVPNPDHNPGGDFALADGRVSNAGEVRLTYSGIGLYHPRLFADCKDGIFPLAPLLRSAANAGRLSGELLERGWHDVGTPERLAALEGIIADQR